MLTIGSDPEFGLVNEDGCQIEATEYLPESTSSEIGVDGHCHIGELRPKHAETPREHVDNIARLVWQISDYVPHDVCVRAGAMVGRDDSIGGHIHFGARDVDMKLVGRTLDYYLALPVGLIERQEPAIRRRDRCGYGGLGDIREQPWGMEYRTLPSWLVSRGIALSVLSVGYAVVDAIMKKEYPKVPQDIPDPGDFYNRDKAALRPLLSDIRRGWRKLPLYPKFRLEFAFLNHLLIHEKEWLDEEDFRPKWDSAVGGVGPHRTVLGNPKDLNCVDIAKRVARGAIAQKVFIYGLGSDRKMDIAVSNVSTAELSQYAIEVARFGCSTDNRFDDWLCIGLSREIRADIPKAVKIVEDILRMESEVKK